MKTIDLKKIKIVHGLPPAANKGDLVALDTEWFKMDEKRMHRPHGIFASLACTMDAKTVYIINDTNEIAPFLERLQAGIHVWHNAKFDITQIKRYSCYPERRNLWDTMLIEQEMFSGYFNDFTLKALARRWLDIYLEKDTREEFETAEEMTKEMTVYAASDVVILFHIQRAQKKFMDANDLTDLDIWRAADRGALWSVVNDMDGIYMDQDGWIALAKEQAEKAAAIQARYEDINLRSPKQVLAELHRVNKSYVKKLKSTGEKILEKIAAECEFARDVLAYRKLSKAASTYGVEWINSIEANGRIYSDFKVNGAATGRLSSAHPNVENIPSDKRYRACFTAAPKHVLIDADWSAQEPRIAAFLSQDQTMIDIFKAKKDIYIEAARLMFGWKLTKKDPRRKERMKPTVLGACYGLSAFGMEVQYNIPQEEGEELLEKFFDTFPQMEEWIRNQQRGLDYVTTILGRKYWLNPYIGKSDRNAINSPVQGSAGDALKIAGYRFMRRVDEEFDRMTQYIYIVNYVHDEIIVECDEDIKEPVMALLKDTMIEVAEEMHPGIPADVEVNYGHTWAEAHG